MLKLKKYVLNVSYLLLCVCIIFAHDITLLQECLRYQEDDLNVCTFEEVHANRHT